MNLTSAWLASRRGARLAALLAALSLGNTLFAQSTASSLSGTVQDAGGALIPGASVTLTNAQGFVRTTATNSSGFFAFPDLTSSTFDMVISSPGFKRYEQRGIEVLTSAQRSLGVITMAIGELSESVTVTADAAAVELASGEKANTLTGTDLQTMGIRGRDVFDAIGLMTGIVDTTDSRESPGNNGMNNIFILGGRSTSKNVTVDGATNMDTGSNNTAHTMPPMDAVGELKVLMSNYAAEYGRNSGGSIIIVTKGGGKNFHASAGFYYRHESLSANNYFNNRNGIVRAPYRYKIFPYTVSGPIFLPGKTSRSEAKLFFFWSQELQRERSNGGIRTVTVPTALERQGDFSQTYDVNARLISILDPQNGRTQYPGNVIPQSRINPVGQKVLQLFPLPNFVDPIPSNRYQWNYRSESVTPAPRSNEALRIDWSPKTNLQTYFRIGKVDSYGNPFYGSWQTGNINFPLAEHTLHTEGRSALVHTTATLSPNLFNEAVLSGSYNRLNIGLADDSTVSRSALGIAIPQWNPGQNPNNYIPNMTFSGVQNYANPSLMNSPPYRNSNPVITFSDNLSWIRGTHTVKFGFYYERTRKDESAQVATRGTVAFDRNNNSPVDTNYAYSNALIGSYNSYTEATRAPRGQYMFQNREFYVQDAWRARRTLLLDYGIRFYADPPQRDLRNQTSSFNPALWNRADAPTLLIPGFDANRARVAVDPLTGATYPQGLIGTFAPGRGNPANGMFTPGVTPGYGDTLYTTAALAVAPRFGFSWDPFGRGRTAIRGGAGIFFDRIMGTPTMDTLTNPPTVFSPTVYYGNIADLATAGGKGILAPTTITGSLLGEQKQPRVYNFSFGVQQQIGRSTIIDISYAGSVARHLLWKRNINATPMGSNWVDVNPQNADPTNRNTALPANFLRPYQGFGDINLYEFGSTSSYNSAQISVNRRFQKGFLFGFAYTFSKALGTASSDTANVDAFLAPRSRNYGPLSYDRTHNANLRYTYAIPKLGKRLGSRTLGLVTDGWELSGTGRFRTGAPFTPGYSLVDFVDITGSTSGARVNIGDPSAEPKLRFARPQRGEWGNAGPGILRLPGTNVWDTSLFKNFKFHERLNTQLRLETYNTFNHTNFSGVNTTARFSGPQQVDPTFLDYTSAVNQRRVQLALRLNW